MAFRPRHELHINIHLLHVTTFSLKHVTDNTIKTHYTLTYQEIQLMHTYSI